ncbi:hypothetical protein NLX83_21080 [Allokutzneria sp. A3M-2-11 16]|uniref:hypothetical protein n=1 Tax=Allokutzneria sp. A3M-2-11 16 TaxID=2962043 RepID=UPI0020B7051E|nr:hypothetical protein [Allokutzneria sp. A3M-2-11 16]MCP3801761.1 hypothetical protein [Allokutzneria sp. A3M-2-11 16]
MSKKAEETGGPEDVDAAFAAIVAGLQREGVSGDWPDGEREERKRTKAPEPEATRPEPTPDPASRSSESTLDPASRSSADDHFVPPDPPPLPPLRPATLGALALFCLGALLLIAPNVLGLAASTGTPLALLAISGGIGWLVLRMRKGPPPDSGWDDGAQV